MNDPTLTGLILSDFTIDTLKSYLDNSPLPPHCELTTGPFGQVIPLIADASHAIWSTPSDFAIIWAQASTVIPSFQKLTRFEPVQEKQLLSECDDFINAVKIVATRVRFVFVANWTLPPFFRGYGPIDHKTDLGWQSALTTLNKRLNDALSPCPNVFVLNTSRWTQTIGEQAFNPKLWYMGKIPFDPAVFRLAAHDIKNALLACLGRSRKVILIDLDDTLWGGTVGETGPDGITLGGHDAVGEAFVDFQRTLKSYKNRGIILGIISKNDASIALNTIDTHPEMILRREDFAGWRINWQDKAENIVALLAELNLGLESAVFIDNSKAERDRVHQALPDVLVPDWPEHNLLFTKALMSLSCFDTIFVGSEDRARTQMYNTETQRQTIRAQIPNIADWIKSLNIIISVERLSSSNLSRATQLLNKTNQMNLSTRRLSENEFMDWAKQSNNTTFTFRIKDNLGDSGLTGIASVSIDGTRAHIVDFVLSCRVFGRQIENILAAIIIEHAKTLGAQTVTAQFVPSAKNMPCLEFLRDRSGFSKEPNNSFTWNTHQSYPRPPSITVNHAS